MKAGMHLLDLQGSLVEKLSKYLAIHFPPIAIESSKKNMANKSLLTNHNLKKTNLPADLFCFSTSTN